MADLPEREQADTSFDTLYHLAKKLEASHQPCGMAIGGTLTHDPHKGYKKYSTPGRHAATVEADLFPLDPELVESAPPKPDHTEGLSLRMTQAMNHYQKQEHHSCVGIQDTSCGTVHIVKSSAHGTRAFKLLRGRPEEQQAHPKEQPIEVVARVISYPECPQPWRQGL